MLICDNESVGGVKPGELNSDIWEQINKVNLDKLMLYLESMHDPKDVLIRLVIKLVLISGCFKNTEQKKT